MFHPTSTLRNLPGVAAATHHIKAAATYAHQTTDTFCRNTARKVQHTWSHMSDPANLPPAAGKPKQHRTELLSAACMVGAAAIVAGRALRLPAVSSVFVGISTVAQVLCFATLSELLLKETNGARKHGFGVTETILATYSMVSEGRVPRDRPWLGNVYRAWQSAEVCYAHVVYRQGAWVRPAD